MKEDLTLQEYKDAVWDFMLEHSDVMPKGSLFIKFHAKDRAELERRIRARAKYNYHRLDERTGETHRQKEERAILLRAAHITQKNLVKNARKTKREKWSASEAEKKAALKEVQRLNDMQMKYGRIYPVVRYIHRLYTSLTRKIKHYE